MGTILADNEHTAWLYNEVTKFNTVVKKGMPISVGDIQGTVVEIEPDAVQIKRADGVWRLAIGKDLRSMTRVAAGGARRLDVFGLFRRLSETARRRSRQPTRWRPLPLPLAPLPSPGDEFRVATLTFVPLACLEANRATQYDPPDCLVLRRGDRVADCAGLENQCARKGTQGSNPCLSARFRRSFRSPDDVVGCGAVF